MLLVGHTVPLKTTGASVGEAEGRRGKESGEARSGTGGGLAGTSESRGPTK